MGSSRGGNMMMMPVISKTFCSSSEAVFVVRRRPHVVTGGGFVVTDCKQNVVFRVEGCGVLGKKNELLLRDANGDALILIRRKGGLVEAVSIYKQWRGYSSMDYELGSNDHKPVFRVKEPNYLSCIVNPNHIKISINNNVVNNDFEIKGYFPDKACSIMDSKGNVIAQVGVKEEVVASNDLYEVVVKPGIDQAFVFGVVAVLDYIYDGSTRC